MLIKTCTNCGSEFSTKERKKLTCSKACMSARIAAGGAKRTGANAGLYKHGGMLNRKPSPEYNSWRGMRERCLDPKSKSYPRYGGRGISVCDRWLGADGFANFLADMGLKPTPEHSIDRLDPNGNYEPANCRWATKQQQASENRRPAKLPTHCRRGHPRSPENRVPNGTQFGACKACREITNARRNQTMAATA